MSGPRRLGLRVWVLGFRVGGVQVYRVRGLRLGAYGDLWRITWRSKCNIKGNWDYAIAFKEQGFDYEHEKDCDNWGPCCGTIFLETSTKGCVGFV